MLLLFKLYCHQIALLILITGILCYDSVAAYSDALLSIISSVIFYAYKPIIIKLSKYLYIYIINY